MSATSSGGSQSARASEDPTQSKSLRNNFRRRFHSRWRTARGEVRSLIQGDDHFRPSSDRPWDTQAAQVGDFRERLIEILDDVVAEPLPQRGVRRGRHYTGPFVKRYYLHGITQADRALDEVGWDINAPTPEQSLSYRPHQQQLAGNYLEAYDDVQDAVRAGATEGYRSYRNSVKTTAAVGTTVAAVNDRLDKTGRYRTDLVAEAKGVQTINEAALTRYEQVGVEQVGVAVELEEQDPDEPRDPSDEEYDFVTAGDLRVCSECAMYGAGGPYRIEDIRNGTAPMPVRDTHPRCRCLIYPTSPS